MRRKIVSVFFLILGFASQVSANVIFDGNLTIKNGGSIVFPDNTKQSTAAQSIVGPQGPQGPEGPQGIPGPPGQVTLDALCAAITTANAAPPSFCPVTCAANGSIAGVWVKTGSSPLAGFDVITFMDSSHYFQVTTAFGTNGTSPGLEKGNYKYSAASGALTVTTDFDTNGTSGFNNGSGGPFTVTVCNNTMSVNSASGVANYNRLLPADKPIVGAWGVNYTDSATGKLGGIIAVMLDNSNFVFGQAGAEVADPTGQTGVEQGIYNWDQNNGQFSTAVTFDNNGQWGMSNPRGARTVTISGTTLTLTDSVEGPFQLNAVGR